MAGTELKKAKKAAKDKGCLLPTRLSSFQTFHNHPPLQSRDNRW